MKETLEATKGMLEGLQEELESHDNELQQKLHDAENKLEQEKIANRSLSQQLQSEQAKLNSLSNQLKVTNQIAVFYYNSINHRKPQKMTRLITN